MQNIRCVEKESKYDGTPERYACREGEFFTGQIVIRTPESNVYHGDSKKPFNFEHFNVYSIELN